VGEGQALKDSLRGWIPSEGACERLGHVDLARGRVKLDRDFAVSPAWTPADSRTAWFKPSNVSPTIAVMVVRHV